MAIAKTDSEISYGIHTNLESSFSGLKENENIKTTDQNIYSKFGKILDIILYFLLKGGFCYN